MGCYFTRDPRSPSLSAKAHGRVGMIIKALELSLAVVYSLNHTFGLVERIVGRGCELEVVMLLLLLCAPFVASVDFIVFGVSSIIRSCPALPLTLPAEPLLLCLQLVCVLFSGLNVYLNLMYLPFYKPIMNIANIIHSGMFSSATLFLGCCWFRGEAKVRESRYAMLCTPPQLLKMPPHQA